MGVEEQKKPQVPAAAHALNGEILPPQKPCFNSLVVSDFARALTEAAEMAGMGMKDITPPKGNRNGPRP